MLPKEITSLQHPIVKEFVKLRESRKHRYEKRKVVIAGRKQIEEAGAVDTLLTLEGKELPQASETYLVTEGILKKTTGLKNPEGMVAIVEMPKASSLQGVKKLLALDGISDPGNLGTLIRTALALGWEGVFLTAGSADPFNDKALAAAKGATFRLPIGWGPHEELIQLAHENGLQGIVADMGGKPLENQKFSAPLLILGNEGSGVSLLLKQTFSTLSIPIHGIESLNVAAAGAIFMYTLAS